MLIIEFFIFMNNNDSCVLPNGALRLEKKGAEVVFQKEIIYIRIRCRA